jgi:DNA-directed RNA polymerase
LNDKIQRQFALEQESIQLGINRYQKALHESKLSDTPPGVTLIKDCIEPFVERIKEFNGTGVHGQVKQFLELFDPYEIAWLTAKRCINCILKTEVIQQVSLDVAEALINHLEYKRFKDEHPGFLSKVESNLHTSNIGHRRTVIMRAKRLLGIDDVKITDKAKIGLKLIYLFIESTHWLQIDYDWKSRMILVGNPEIKQKIEEVNKRFELLDPIFMPMIIKPWPWLTVLGGGYLSSESTITQKLVRTRDYKFLQRLADREMPEVYESINNLQTVPYRINKRIFGVMQHVWDQGGILGGLPPKEEEPDAPKTWIEGDTPNPNELKNWKRAQRLVHIRRVQTTGQRVEVLHKLRIAEKFLEEPEIYFCWNKDFRGRFYPIQNFLHPQGCDTSRALLEFAKGKPLGSRGVDWLKILLANNFGIDKANFDDRIQWAKEHEQEILDSAINPIDGQRFWTEADDPWQFLAACFEYENYKDYGEDYCSHLPIVVDATASGLQHLSALLKDPIGGAAVNLIPGDKPSDIYGLVAQKLIEILEYDQREGRIINNIQQIKNKKEIKCKIKTVDEKFYANEWLNYGIDRNLVKRPTMTSPYNVTRYGVVDQLIDEVTNKMQAEYIVDACQYLAPKTLTAIHQVVIAAAEVMDWLKEIASICSDAGIPIEWVTPTGFLVHQEYQSTKKKTVTSYFGKSRIFLRYQVNNNNLNKNAQINGIAPNFIHSLDASHLDKTINQCFKEGITSFICIHDSFGTHACDMDKLNRILRETFVEMYSKDLLADFRDQILNQLPEEFHDKIPSVPEHKDLDINQVLKSPYFFN